jgi:hypothetical protein
VNGSGTRSLSVGVAVGVISNILPLDLNLKY